MIDDVESIREIIRRDQIDVVHAHPFYSVIPAFFAAALENKPFLITVHGISSLFPADSLLYSNFLKGIVFKRAGRVFAISQEVLNIVSIYSNQAVLLENGVEMDRFKPCSPVDSGKWAIIGRVDEFKLPGISDFIDKLAACGEKNFDVLGPIADAAVNGVNDMVRQAQDRGLSLCFMGQANDLFSVMFQGGYCGIGAMGRGALEGLAMNLPVFLVGYDGVKGLINGPLFKKARYFNMSGRGLSTLPTEAIRQALQDLRCNNGSYRLREKLISDIDSGVIWSKYLSATQRLRADKAAETIKIYDIIRSHQGKRTPYIYDYQLLEDYLATTHSGDVDIFCAELLRKTQLLDSRLQHLGEKYDNLLKNVNG
jgi:glycosyltransferase involved in cell wall biosynthesis